MKKLLASAAACLGVVAIAGAANAAPVTFVFQNPGADLPTNLNINNDDNVNRLCNGVQVSSGDICTVNEAVGLDYAKSGIDLNVTAQNGLANNVAALLQDLQPNNSGLAVVSEGEGGRDDQVQLISGESLTFQFSTNVILTEIDFNAGNDKDCTNFNAKEGPCGNFRLFVNGADQGEFAAVDNFPIAGIVGDMFRVVATGPADISGFAIGSLTVQTLPDISQVPVPGAAIFLASGLGGLALRRRQKS